MITFAELGERINKAMEADRQKAGGLHPYAMGSLGLCELREVFSPGGNIASPAPPGIFGMPTQGETADAREISGNVYGPVDDLSSTETVLVDDPLTSARQQAAAMASSQARQKGMEIE